MGFNREETIAELDKFWETEIKYWKGLTGVTELANKRSLEEMGNMELKYSPFYPYPDERYKLDVEGVKDFFRYKKMDIYGKDWKTKTTGGRNWK